jgi:uncharacterized protein (DUF433 family)
MSGTIPIVNRLPSHITLDGKGNARIDGTRMKVLHLVEAWKAGADSVEKLQTSYPHLTLGQIHAAMSYYYDHQKEIDDQIARELKEFEEMRAAAPETPGRKKLRDLGLLP